LRAEEESGDAHPALATTLSVGEMDAPSAVQPETMVIFAELILKRYY